MISPFLFGDPGLNMVIPLSDSDPSQLLLDSTPFEDPRTQKISVDFGWMNKFNTSPCHNRQVRVGRRTSGERRTLRDILTSAVAMLTRFRNHPECNGLPEMAHWYLIEFRQKPNRNMTFVFVFVIRWQGKIYHSHGDGSLEDSRALLQSPPASSAYSGEAVRTYEAIDDLLAVDRDDTTSNSLLLASAFANYTMNEFASVDPNFIEYVMLVMDNCVRSGRQIPAFSTALANIRIYGHHNPAQFLGANNLYDPIVVGRFCEDLYPDLAYMAYFKGSCDNELIALTNKNSMFKQQARYLVGRRQSELWAQVLAPGNIYRLQLIEEIISTALPECIDIQDVYLVVEAFRSANCPLELIRLLEKVILEPSLFNEDRYLQTTMVCTAICADRDKVSVYIDKLWNYNLVLVAEFLKVHGLYDAARVVWEKTGGV